MFLLQWSTLSAQRVEPELECGWPGVDGEARQYHDHETPLGQERYVSLLCCCLRTSLPTLHSGQQLAVGDDRGRVSVYSTTDRGLHLPGDEEWDKLERAIAEMRREGDESRELAARLDALDRLVAEEERVAIPTAATVKIEELSRTLPRMRMVKREVEDDPTLQPMKMEEGYELPVPTSNPGVPEADPTQPPVKQEEWREEETGSTMPVMKQEEGYELPAPVSTSNLPQPEEVQVGSTPLPMVKMEERDESARAAPRGELDDDEAEGEKRRRESQGD